MSISEIIEDNIRFYTQLKGIRLYELAKAIGMTEAGLYKMFSTGSYKIKTLEHIANTIDLPLADLISRRNDGADNRTAVNDETLLAQSQKIIKLLLASIEDKSRIITLLTHRSEDIG